MSDVPFSTLRMDESVTVCFLRMSGNSGDMGSIAVGKWRAFTYCSRWCAVHAALGE